MDKILHITSATLAFAALAPSLEVGQSSLLQRLFRRFRKVKPEPVSVLAPPPTVRNEGGWTFVQCDDMDSFTAWLEKDEQGLPFSDGESPSLGSHLLVELFDCNPESLKLESTVGKAMIDAAVVSEATIVADSFHEFKPYGVSGAVIIQESHYTIHTWPEHGYAAVDLFYCGGTIHVHKAMDTLKERFQPGRVKFLVVRRGVQSEVER